MRISKYWKTYKSYIEKYENKLKLKCLGQEINEKDQKYLDFLEKQLNLVSIMDARFHCKEKIKVILKKYTRFE
jgi:hypothetical protein